MGRPRLELPSKAKLGWPTVERNPGRGGREGTPKVEDLKKKSSAAWSRKSGGMGAGEVRLGRSIYMSANTSFS